MNDKNNMVNDREHCGYGGLKYIQKLREVWGWVGSNRSQGRVCWQ